MVALIALFLGIALGLLLSLSTFWIIKAKCPKCKKLRPLQEIIIFSWKSRQITGKKCRQCRQIKPQVDIF